MKLTIEGNAEEIKNVLQAIGGSKEHKETMKFLKIIEKHTEPVLVRDSKE